MLLIFTPLTLVGGSIQMCVNTISIGFVILPFAIVDITVSVDQATLACGSTIFPIALILTAIGPDLSASALSGGSSCEPLTSILSIVI